nr:sugar transferase [uncultured Allomuricauda sp.]
MSRIKNQFNESNFENTTFLYGENQIPKFLGNIPIRPDIFLGRSQTLDGIHDRLKNNNHFLLLVNGIGGIGKTTMASKYYFEFTDYYSHLIWILPKEGITEAIVTLADSLSVTFDEKNQISKKRKATEIARAISGLQKPILIIIDNANSLSDLNENFQLLRQIHGSHILITSRVDQYQNVPTLKVDSLDEKSANELFKYYYKNFKREEQLVLDKILKAIQYNTLVIELLSKNLNEFNNELIENYPLKKLLSDIQEKGVLKISKSTPVDSDYQLQRAKPEDVIRTMYDISNISKDDKKILLIFSLLPNISFSYEYLKDLMPLINQLDIKLLNLSRKGWVDYDKNLKSFKVHAIISEITRENIKPVLGFSKRLFDISFSLIVIVLVLSWLIPVLGLIIKLESRGPVFFKQERLGIKGRVIALYKFRSLVEDYNPNAAVRNDLRVTRVGRFIRKTSIDELPQFFNVLTGEMSIVGPRAYLNFQSESEDSLLKIVKSYAKPGITGLAQVKGYRGELESYGDMKIRAKYDVFYIERWSLLLDIKIILQTILISFKGEEKAY